VLRPGVAMLRPSIAVLRPGIAVLRPRSRQAPTQNDRVGGMLGVPFVRCMLITSSVCAPSFDLTLRRG